MGSLVDIVITGGRVLDGTGGAPLDAAVAIDGDRIAGVGEGFRGRRTIDARGRYVAPGFIDVHTHTDFTLPIAPAAEAKLLQGFTTDVTGNCGFSPFPLHDSDAGRAHGAFLEPALTERWPTLAAYAAALRDAATGINVAPLVGLGAVRLAVVGEEQREATPDELDAMAAMVERAMVDGAFGVSSGLIYAPSGYANVDELSRLARASARHGGFYASHLRDEGDGLVEAVREALKIGERGGASVQLSHHKVLGRRNWGLVRTTLAEVDAANGNGADVWLDAYPYTAGSTSLITLLPPGELRAGERELRRRLGEPAFRAAVADDIRARAQFRVDEVRLGSVPSRPELGGRRLIEAAQEEGVDPAELVIRLVERDGSDVVMIGFGMDEADVRRVLEHPRTLIGSDGWVLSANGSDHVHPRNFACAPRLLARYVRDDAVLGLTEAVAKLTGWAAGRLGLSDRGRIAPGMAADVVVFDLERMQEGSTYEDPSISPSGVEEVLVNGRQAVTDGTPTGARAGRVLARDRTPPARVAREGASR
jgi:N-acyl-D-amino-acid deacylase